MASTKHETAGDTAERLTSKGQLLKRLIVTFLLVLGCALLWQTEGLWPLAFVASLLSVIWIGWSMVVLHMRRLVLDKDPKALAALARHEARKATRQGHSG